MFELEQRRPTIKTQKIKKINQKSLILFLKNKIPSNKTFSTKWQSFI